MHVDGQRLLQRLAAVTHLQPCQRIVACAQQVRRAVQDASALGAGQRRPLRETALRRSDRGVDIGAVGVVDDADPRSGGRVQLVKSRTAADPRATVHKAGHLHQRSIRRSIRRNDRYAHRFL